MNYIALVNAFWRKDKTKRFSPLETRLYFYLLDLFNTMNWPGSVKISNKELTHVMDCSVQNLRTARKNLEQTNLISYSPSTRGNPGTYTLITPDQHVSNTRKRDIEKPSRNDTGVIHYLCDQSPTLTCNHTHKQQADNTEVPPDNHEPISLYKVVINETKQKETKRECVQQAPLEKIVSLYHESCKELPRISSLTHTRRFLLQKRWKEHPDLDFWQSFFERVNQSDWLSGRIEGRNNTVFRTNLEWMLKEDNFTRIIEGFYDTYVLAPVEELDQKNDSDGSKDTEQSCSQESTRHCSSSNLKPGTFNLASTPSTLDPIPFVGNLEPSPFNLVPEPETSNLQPGGGCSSPPPIPFEDLMPYSKEEMAMHEGQYDYILKTYFQDFSKASGRTATV
jgi:hypothetical protein